MYFMNEEKIELTADEQKTLLELSRKSLTYYLTCGKRMDIDQSNFSERLRQKRGVFVTLHKDSKLRGCIGNIFPENPIFLAVAENAINAGVGDPRFPNMSADEMKDVAFEISILSKPVKITFSSPEDLLSCLDRRTGIILKKGRHQSTFLPQVWNEIPDKAEFLSHLAMKAGLASDEWKDPRVEVFYYSALVFSEE